jgi:type I restriction enzyme M protein
MNIKDKTIALIDSLKATCQTYGMGNDGNEYKIITQVFLYKFMADKFGYELKKINDPCLKALKKSDKWEEEYAKLSKADREKVSLFLPPEVPVFKPDYLIANLWNKQAKGNFDVIFDETMVAIAKDNLDVFYTKTAQDTKIPIFEKLTIFVTDDAQRANFARALVDKLVNFSFEDAFAEHYDFFSDIFEYLLKDYNTAGGGKYAEYYTPKAIAKIMARLLVGDNADLHNVECYDPSAGTGTLLMALSHQIGEDRCTIFAQDISQRSNKMLKLNLLLNGLVSSLDHAVQGDTLLEPYHKSDDGKSLKQFDYVVSNPPFKMDFSDTRDDIEKKWNARFWAGGKGAIVIPTGFITAKSGIEHKILERIVDEHIVYGVVSMPSNVFANTGTNVSVLFFDKTRKKTDKDKVTLVDASKLGKEYKDANGLKKVRLEDDEIEKIVTTFRKAKAVEDFSVVVTYSEVKEKGYSLSAGQYFDIKIDYVDITEEEFNSQMKADMEELNAMFAESHKLEKEIQKQLASLSFGD